jgi:hypothetical protein
MNRRNFLTRSGLALGALIVGDEVLEMLDRLTHRKVYALGGVPRQQETMIDMARRIAPSNPELWAMVQVFERTSPILFAHRTALASMNRSMMS